MSADTSILVLDEADLNAAKRGRITIGVIDWRRDVGASPKTSLKVAVEVEV